MIRYLNKLAVKICVHKKLLQDATKESIRKKCSAYAEANEIPVVLMQ